MTKPKCRDCGCEAVVWGSTKAGAPLLMELRPHFIYCPKRRKKAAAQVSGSPDQGPSPRQDAITALVESPSMGYKVREAKEMVGRVPAEVIAAGDVAQIVIEALQQGK